ncbi:MAG: TonB C-terminal domain-containing protein [Verrucomicrobiota bacterium]|jgi:outer membrane biosynthesis protein TonB
MLPQSHQRKKKNSSKVNLTISFVFHAVLIGALLYFAAREGLLGKKIQKISVTMVKEKTPEKPKEPEKPKAEPPKVEPPKNEPPKYEEPKPAAAPVSAPPVVAPENQDVASFAFSDGAKAVNTESDPVQLYKGYVEYVLRSKWNRPNNLADDKYLAEVQVSVDKAGNLSNIQWEKGSGDSKWDQSIKDVFKEVQSIDRRPPTNFPPQVRVRFDIQSEETEPIMTQ